MIPVWTDTVQLDTLSIAPRTFRILIGGEALDTAAYKLDFINAKLIWKKSALSYLSLTTDSLPATYRVFSFLLGESIRFKKTDIISTGVSPSPFYYNPGSDEPELFRTQGLTRSGSISRGITFGNNQDVFVNSSLNLQLSGKLSDNVDILAAITDENIPVQPEGNTQQLQDFDKVFIQVSNNRNKLIAGDFELRRPDSYFMNFYKKGQGGLFTTEIPLSVTDTINKKRILRSGVSAAVSKGKFSRNTVAVKESNQGPYRLTGNNGETYIVILSGTEKIYFNGILLVRGAQNDYVIDYNSAELTFTARRLITKDSRIVAEFEYSDKNYARSLIFTGHEFESNKLKIKLNVYSEQDSKNQPLSLDLDSAKKAVLAGAGDDLLSAVYPTADSVPFTTNAVLYEKTDTIVNALIYQIFRYSTDPAVAYWQVNYSEVGVQHGDYIQDVSTANGRVYKWVAPINGVSQGSFAPVAILASPKQQQMVTTGVEFKINNTNSVIAEGAFSNYDVNLFSAKDNFDNKGGAARILYNNKIFLTTDTAGWRLDNLVNYEFTGKYFRPIERYRNVEFERDWNIGSTQTIANDEHVSSFQTSLVRPGLGNVTYQLRSFNKGSAYRGLMNAGSTNLLIEKFKLSAVGSYLNSEGVASRTRYLRHAEDLSRGIWKVVVGMRESSEVNRFYSRANDSLLLNSFMFNELEGYVNTRDSTKASASLSYKQRIDQLPTENNFKISTIARESNLSTEFSGNPNNVIRTSTTYRMLTVRDTLLTTQEPVKTLLNRIDHSLNLFNGVFTFNTYYEVGSGQERRQEFYYLKVESGQGVYAFVDDNNNGIEDLGEFTIAAFQDQAEYIRVYVPTNEYISTRSNQFSEVLTISPAGNRSSMQGKDNFTHRLSNQVSVRLDRRTREESLLSSLNPFSQNLSDTLLIAASSNFRNTLYYNKLNTTYGADFTYQENRSKSFLANGFETRIQRSRIVNLRWNATRSLLATLNFENGDKINESDFFSLRDYIIYSNSLEPKLSFQPGAKVRVSASYRYGEKINTKGELHEHAITNRITTELKYTAVNSGNITAKISLINIEYSSADDSFLSYEMLEGFKNGKNYTWSAAVQRSLSNSVQLSLTYDGRKLEESPAVHTGGVQFRAFF